MWVITLFIENSYRIFEFDTKIEATKMLESLKGSAILSYTY